jgi:hypothetical protein
MSARTLSENLSCPNLRALTEGIELRNISLNPIGDQIFNYLSFILDPLSANS